MKLSKKQTQFQTNLKKLRVWAKFLRNVVPSQKLDYPTRLLESFTWSHTKEGHDYWSTKEQQLLKLEKQDEQATKKKS
jgi:hypothetical protein